ncbi:MULTISPECIES: patatin-like phospholipase family protein [Fervidobacterium]|uniref:Patatin n=1 Tax=Fervidobacterium nodosum (strain ATCC 35602 / DSM 5306 / Rt17-B1) TaxID=381764 RepID=A7HJQ6_FERNB|nr:MULTISPECIES: patatin-like phospholipase family protein [Fervidobacterium]ABS60139.1 Patatin [Fervidobacterium nodosum Rt17-B1]KAF2961739.1 patatin [Fervidobacterium sp. 2310opik-2]PHJ13883.1 patatin [Fervidobacterium sp. SC_NGM5_G05]
MIGLALEAGGVKGFSHIATLKLFELCGKKPDIISGSSFGSIVGTLYALYQDSEKVYGVLAENITNFLKRKKFSNFKFFNFELILVESLVDLDDYYDFFKSLYGRAKFSDLKIPVDVVAFDMENLESIVINEGFLVDAVLASCTVPGVFEPTYIAGTKMLDGGVLSPVPVIELRNKGVERVVASIFEEPKNSYNTHMELMLYIDSIKGDIILQREIETADFVISYPISVQWTELEKYREVYNNALKIIYNRRDEFENFIGR